MHIPELAPGFGERRKNPPLREPVRMRTWLIVALVLAAIWFVAKPPGARKKLDARIDAAIALTADCKMDEAKAELNELKSTKATGEQVARLQDAITAAVPVCEKKRASGKAWAETREAIEFALQSDLPDKAAARLALYTKKWGENADTREWTGKIETKRAEHLLDAADACLTRADRVCLENNLLAAEKFKRPELAQRTLALRDALSRLLESTVLGQASAPVPEPAQKSNLITTSPAVAQNAQQARRVLADAEHELVEGNYKAAMAKAEQCAAMSETGNHECQVLWQKANRLNADMQRCLSGGAEWINDHCQ